MSIKVVNFSDGYSSETSPVVSALQGSTGPQGFTGPQGADLGPNYTGETGIQGIQGYTGSQGQTGVQGETGVQGIKGDLGVTGAIGATGLDVGPNYIGSTGVQGIEGPQGILGAMGHTGTQGIQGPQGYTGIQGLQGIDGDDGIQGSTGIQGITGVRGFTGLIGETGVQGIQGYTGSQGFVGETGPLGVTGAEGIGLQGPRGMTGVSIFGETGVQGIQGITGVGVRGETGIKGEMGFGIQGPEGEQGIQGLTGPMGHTGAGIQGETGLAGADGSIGETGVQGPQGETGPAGIDGDSLWKRTGTILSPINAGDGLSVDGDVVVTNGVLDAKQTIGDSSTANSYLQLVADSTYSSYGARLLRYNGANGNTVLQSRGNGELQIRAEEYGTINFYTQGAKRASINSDGVMSTNTLLADYAILDKSLTLRNDGDYWRMLGNSSSSNRFELSHNGVERMYIDDNGMTFRNQTTNNARVQFNTSTTDHAFLDFVGDNVYTDYGLRLIRNPGENGPSQLTHHGTGRLELNALDSGYIQLSTSNTSRMTIGTTGNVKIPDVYSNDKTADTTRPVVVGTDGELGYGASSGGSSSGDFGNFYFDAWDTNTQMSLTAGSYVGITNSNQGALLGVTYNANSTADKLTIATGGKYKVTYNVGYIHNQGGFVRARVYKNGTFISPLQSIQWQLIGQFESVHGSTILTLAANDYLDIRMGTSNTGIMGLKGVELTVEYLGA